MTDCQPEPVPDRILVAQLTGEAKHHARWRDLTEAEETPAVADLRELAAGRTDLLAEVAGILEGASEGELNEPIARARRRSSATRPGRTRRRSLRGSRKGGAVE